MSYKLGITLFILFVANSSLATNIGIGVSSHTSGRLVPALNVGKQFGTSLYTSFTTVGVQTKAYYDTSYSLNILKTYSAGSIWSKPLKAGLGIGVAFGQKGLDPDPEGVTPEKEEILVDRDYNYGPAFKVTYYPLAKTYIGVEYLLGMGNGAAGLGFGDVGIWSLGVEF